MVADPLPPPFPSGRAALDVKLADTRDAVEATGGGYWALDDAGAVEGIVSEIDAREAGLFEGTRRLVVLDAPGVPAVVGLLALAAGLVLLWRYRL